MPQMGLEPILPQRETVFKTVASTGSATGAFIYDPVADQQAEDLNYFVCLVYVIIISIIYSFVHKYKRLKDDFG